MLFIVPRYEILARINIHYRGQALESSRTSTMEFFCENSYRLKAIVDARQGSKYTSDINHQIPPSLDKSGIAIYLRPRNVLCSRKRVEIFESFISLITLFST